MFEAFRLLAFIVTALQVLLFEVDAFIVPEESIPVTLILLVTEMFEAFRLLAFIVTALHVLLFPVDTLFVEVLDILAAIDDTFRSVDALIMVFADSSKYP